MTVAPLRSGAAARAGGRASLTCCEDEPREVGLGVRARLLVHRFDSHLEFDGPSLSPYLNACLVSGRKLGDEALLLFGPGHGLAIDRGEEVSGEHPALLGRARARDRSDDYRALGSRELLSADDAGGNVEDVAQGVADGDSPVADPHRRGVAEISTASPAT